jgi:hypothetical protein
MKALKTEISRAGAEIPCLMAHQLNRASLDEKEGIALRHFAGASEVEQTCDLALGLARNKQERANKAMQCHILGARRSDVGAWLLTWNLTDATLISVAEPLNLAAS